MLMLNLLFTLISCLAALAPHQPAAQDDAWVTKDILILQSTRDYKTALATARQAAARLRMPLNLEGYQPHAQSGLTMSKADCADNGFDYPAYVARGRNAEEGAFVSVEYSSGYNHFADGYYLVVAAVGAPGSATVRNVSTSARQWYADAYAKRTKVWVGCMH
jgi:hypothetical protein